MKIQRKIKIAFIIDEIILLFLFLPIIVLIELIPPELSIIKSFVYPLIVLPAIYVLMAFMPLTFKNASPGMKLLKLKIVDENGNCPSKKQIIKRGIQSPRWASANFKCLLLGEDTSEWELKNWGTCIVHRAED